MKIRCAVIDDERLAREYIINYIAKIPQLELIGDFNSPLKAMDLIKEKKVDLLFLDIQMPDITGINFMKSLDHKPEVIFTTAYQEYAIEGFNINATDYLLKPFSFERFFQAVNKVIDKFELKNDPRNSHITDEQTQTKIADTYLTVRADRKLYKINFDHIKFIEGQRAYVTFHTHNKKITALASLKDLEDSLPEKDFIRIHKSYIVSVKEILSLEGNIIEVDNVKLPVGKNYKEAVLKIFG
ncbi:LytR/AlgR family response regulator transcription factor [Plebeiibacterium marinum]|uniref:LytTR family DNA-binding domain-containing protein n=1 Tax=Plebeiibacterium marinum TaxID=2992111 RepID=A0AAE3MBB0_9BACT|nr:LytTR family DNA-binding domain-containing protein [Plebeiobacterium marinum]MCW3804540.1 LytTR family DNA-binding domain-containing protein [Plebeiobacterium marinum]